MKKFTTFVLALAATATYTVAQSPYRTSATTPLPLDGTQTEMSDNARTLAASGAFDRTTGQSTARVAPKPLGGSYSEWEMLGTGRFNAELGVMSPCDVNIYYCTTDPSGMGMGVDAYYIEGIFDNYLPVVSMPFIDYTNIGNVFTGKYVDNKGIFIDELSNHYNVGMASTIADLSVGIIKIASLYYTDDPDIVDNVVTYGYETIQLDGDFKDYRVDFEVAGECRDRAALKTNISFVDATNVKIKAYPGALSYPQTLQAANAQHADQTITAIAESGSHYIDLTDDGTYTVIATFDKGDDEWEYLTGTYDYDSRWEEFGTAEFTEDYLASYYDGFPVATAAGIKVERHKVNTGHYRLVNPYSTTDTWVKIYPRLQYAEPEVNSFLVINAENPEKVYIYINPVDITYDDGVRMVCGSAAHYNIINDRGDDVITEKGYWGSFTTTDGVSTVSFPERTLMMRPANTDAPLFANMNGGFKVVITDKNAGISDAVASSDAVATEAYTLTGCRVDLGSAPAGLYLVKYTDGSVRKVVK